MEFSRIPTPEEVASEEGFDPAVRWFAKRLGMTRAQVDQMTLDARRKVFFVTGLADLEAISAVQKSLEKALSEGLTFEEWKSFRMKGEKKQPPPGFRGRPFFSQTLRKSEKSQRKRANFRRIFRKLKFLRLFAHFLPCFCGVFHSSERLSCLFERFCNGICKASAKMRRCGKSRPDAFPADGLRAFHRVRHVCRRSREAGDDKQRGLNVRDGAPVGADDFSAQLQGDWIDGGIDRIVCIVSHHCIGSFPVTAR
jgi:hypothetical protein